MTCVGGAVGMGAVAADMLLTPRRNGLANASG